MKKPFDAKKAVEAEYRRQGHKVKHKQKLSQKFAKAAKVQKQLPTIEELNMGKTIQLILSNQLDTKDVIVIRPTKYRDEE